MKRSAYLPVLAASVIVLAGPAFAQSTAIATSRSTPTQVHNSADATFDERLARDWGLKPEEWARYRQLMEGPLGVYSPNLDPLTALGIEASSSDEQRRYAELQVQAEARRIEKLLAYQRAYDAAWQRLYPNQPRLSLPSANSTSTFFTSHPRIAMFVKDNCAACDHAVQRLQTNGTPFDIYMVGSADDDARLRAWAQRIGLDPAKVRVRTITLNHDDGRWASLGVSGDVPAVVRQVNGQWQRVP